MQNRNSHFIKSMQIIEEDIFAMILYKQFHEYIPLNKMSALQWFSLSKHYGQEYGSISKSYQFRKTPKLLDIGDANVRTMIRETIKPFDPSIAKYSDPDEQYSGGPSNKKYHVIIQKYFGDTYDGTIIDQNNLKGNMDYSAEDLDGASEVVLWKDFDQLLEEERKGGRVVKRVGRVVKRVGQVVKRVGRVVKQGSQMLKRRRTKKKSYRRKTKSSNKTKKQRKQITNE